MGKLVIYGRRGDNNSEGLRVGQVSEKLGRFFDVEFFSRPCKDSIVVVVKKQGQRIPVLEQFKAGNNRIVLDVVDWIDVEKYDLSDQTFAPNFFPKIFTQYFDAYIVNNTRMREWWLENIDTNKPVFVIPHHWDERFESFPSVEYEQKPYFYYLGQANRKTQNCLYVDDLMRDGCIYDHRTGERYFESRPVAGCQINLRKYGSWEYCFKPSTKVSTAAAMGSVIITTNDWSVQDVLSQDYPYLLKSTDYEEVKSMIQFVKDTYEKAEWFEAKKMLEETKKKTDLNETIKLYLEIENHFN